MKPNVTALASLVALVLAGCVSQESAAPAKTAATSRSKESVESTMPPVRSQMRSWSYLDRKKLIEDGVLHDGMTPAEAEALLGPATGKNSKIYDWYWNPGNRWHVAPFFSAELKDEKLYNWQSGNR